MDVHLNDKIKIYAIFLLFLLVWQNGKANDAIYSFDKKSVGDSIMNHVRIFAPLYETIVSEYRAGLYIKGRMDIKKKNFILRYVPSMFSLQKGVRNYLLETYSELHFTSPNIYDQKVKAFMSTVKGDRGLPGVLEYFNINIYSASLLKDERLLSPLSKNSSNYYHFALDTIYRSADKVDYKILFVPRVKSDQLVSGYMLVSDDVWSIREISFSGRSELITFKCLIKMGEVGKLTNENGEEIPVTVIEYVTHDLKQDELNFHNPLHRQILTEAASHLHDEGFKTERYFLAHPSPVISKLAVDLINVRYQLSKYHSKSQKIVTDGERLLELVPMLMNNFKYAIVTEELKHLLYTLQDPALMNDSEKCNSLMKRYNSLREVQSMMARHLGDRVVLR